MHIFYTASIQYKPREGTGGSLHIHNVVRLLRQDGHRVVVFACRPEGVSGTAGSDPDMEYIGPLPKSLPGLIRFNLTYWSRLRQRSKRKPDLLYCRFGVWQFAPILLAKRRRIPLVLEVNGVPDQDRRLGWLHGRLIRWVFRSADRIVVTAERMRTYFAQRYQIPPERFVTVMNGVDCDLYRPLGEDRRTYVPEGLPAVGYVGSLGPNWDLDLLWKAAPRVVKQVPGVLFMVAGESPRETELAEQFARQGLSSHLLFLGQLPYAQAGRLMAECDVLVAPLRPLDRNEMSSPIKVYHYLSVGVPAVASEMEVTKQFEGSGLITFKPGDPEAFAEAVIQCLSLSPEEKQQLGQQGRTFIEQHYTWQHTVSRIEDVIKEVVKSTAQ